MFRPDAGQVRAKANELHEHCYDIEATIPLDEDAFPWVDDLRTCSG